MTNEMTKTEKPNCYECKWRGEIPGDAHICCKHPNIVQDTNNPLGNIMATFASVGRTAPVISTAFAKMGIVGDAHGIKNGWFCWPWNYDPIWLKKCNGFTKNKKGGD